MDCGTSDHHHSDAAFDTRTREVTFWAGVFGLLLSALVYLSIYLSGDLILHYMISSPLYGLFLSAMVLSSYFNFKVTIFKNVSITAIFLLFWLSTYAEAFQSHETFVSVPLTLFVPILLMMVLNHKLVFALASLQFALVLHYTSAYGAPYFAPEWTRAEQINLSLSLACLSAICSVAVGIVSRQRARADAKIQTLVTTQMRLASTDPLTGLPNRRGFTAKLTDLLCRPQSRSDTLTVAIIDLDGFKSVNDVYGHAAGDELLVQASSRLLDCLPDDAHLARLGGDEFGLYLSIDPTKQVELGQRLCEALRTPFWIQQTSMRISGSIGFAELRPSDTAIGNVLERADYALYKSKADAKGSPTVFSDVDEARIERTRQIKRRLLSDDLMNELSVMFQPIVFPKTGKVKAMETLVRWNNPDLGNIPPSEFIPIAERTGRISDITCFVLQRALEVARKWPDHIFISLNLSALDLSSRTSVDRLLEILNASPVTANRVVLEITETALMKDHERGQQNVQAFRDLGVNIALDDFGTGYSSLSYLKQLSIKKLKVDRSFSCDIETDEMSRNLLTGIIELCATVGINCVIEGIETEGQLALVSVHKNTLAQGFYFSKPLSERDALAYVTRPETENIRLIA